MFGNLFRYWVRQTLEDALRQKATQMAASVNQPGTSSVRPKAPETAPSSSDGPGGCVSVEENKKSVTPEEQPTQAAASIQLQAKPQEKSEKSFPGCDGGVVFALESESGGLEDLLQETGRWQGDGFLAIAGRLQERRVVIVRSGAGQAAAAHATEALLDGHRPGWVISAGFAGALQPELKRYDLVLPEAVVRPDGQRWELSPPAEWLSQTALGLVQRGLLLSVDHLVSTPKEKHTLGEQYGALAVDMETFAVVEVCQRRGTPVMAVRILIDLLEEQLPPEVRGLLKQKSPAARLGAALGALWNRPSSLKDLYRLKEQALLASDRLARFLAWAIAELQ